MDFERDWPEGFAERLKWARMRAGYTHASEAARKLAVKPVTWRSWEAGEREPELNEKQRVARRLKVSWTWLASGEGRPDQGVITDESVQKLADDLARLSDDDRAFAIETARGAIAPFLRRVK